MNEGVTLRSGKVLQPNTQEMDFEDSLWSVVESSALLDTQAALNPDDIVALGGCPYVRIEDKTFSVVSDSDVERGSVMVSPASAAEFDEDEVELIAIDETTEAESAHFVLSSGFELPFQGERLLTLSALTKLFHERYDGQILSPGDEFEFFSGLVARFTLPQQSDLEEGTQNYRVSVATRFFFHPEEGEGIKVVEEVVPAEPLQFRDHVTLPQKEDEELFSFLAPNPRHEAGTSASVFPKLINIAKLETHLRNALAGQLLTEGSSLSLPMGLTLQLTTVSTPHALPSCFLEILPVEKAYRFTPHSSISLSSDVENVHLVKGKPVRASSVKFLISEIMGESATRRKEMSSSWLLKTELEEKIRSVLSDFVLTTHFSITHRGVVYSLQVVDASAETVQREHRLDEQSYWIFGRNCSFEVKAAEALNVHVVTDATPRILKKVTFQVASCGHAETQIAVSAEDLKLAIRSELGGVILPGCSYNLTVEGAHLELSVQRALFNEEGLNSSPDIYFGGINAATEIGLRTKTGSNLLIRSTPQPINADDPIDALASLGLAGYDTKVEQAIRMLCLPYGQSRELAAQLGVEAPKGILLKGPPGTGKSSLAHALCKVLGVAEGNIKEISADMVKSMWLGKTEENIRALFEPAQKAWEQGYKDLFVIIIDEIDALAAKRGGIDEHGNKFTNALLSQMDGLNKFGNVLVIGTTNHDTLIDPAFLRPGRFDKQLHFRLPNLEGRKNIFAIHLRALENQRLLHPDIDLTTLSKMTDGMNGSHIEGIVKRAKDLCLLRTSGRKLPKNSPERKVSMADLTSAYEYINDKGDVLENLPFMDQVGCAIPPEQLQEFFKVQGLVGLKEEQSHTLALVAAAYRPHPQAMQQLNINPPRGVLFYGAPGTGKTKMMLALLKMMGVSRRRVACYHAREILQLISEGKAHFDLKSLFSSAYESFKSDPASAELQVLMVEDLHLLKVGTALEAFLHALDQIRQLTNILVVATATKTKDLDLQMAQQPGRFDHTVKTKAPDYAQRLAFFEASLIDSMAR
ncbi:MAG: AAA family ATPase, partial [Chlamydiia bacterium]|nr:AAA family ATPase [Chlamydiia bacterium]